jgi:AraC-like DNA-binding protein
MKNFKIDQVSFHTQKQHFIQEVRHIFLFFCVNGMEYLRTENFEFKNPAPFCYLFFPDDKFEFKYNEKRENWAVIFTCSSIKCISDEQFSFGGSCENIVLPRYIEVTPGDLVRWRNKFDALTASFKTPIPYERVLMELYLMDIFRYYIEVVKKKGQSSPAGKLKELIDASENMHFSIAELSNKCGYSADHLRVLFKNKYEISPQEYRIRRIMAYAMELICKSNLMVSDIADKCGFKYLSHFSSLFKKIHGISPATALKRFRYR